MRLDERKENFLATSGQSECCIVVVVVWEMVEVALTVDGFATSAGVAKVGKFGGLWFADKIRIIIWRIHLNVEINEWYELNCHSSKN